MDEKSGLLFRCCVLIYVDMATVRDEVLQALSIQRTQLNMATHSHARGKKSKIFSYFQHFATYLRQGDNENIEEGLFLAVNYRKKNNALLKSSGSMVLHGSWFSAILQNQSID